MEKDIQAWLENVHEDSQFQSDYWKSRGLDDPDGWGTLLAPAFYDSSTVSGSGILLTGSDSHSKLSVVLQILALLKPEAYQGIFLSGTDLCDEGFVKAVKRLDALLDRFYDNGMGLCLIVDDMEECSCRHKLLQFLGQKLCEYNMYRDQLTPLFLILSDDSEHDIPALLRDCLRLCRLQLPNKAKRAAYLDKYAKSLRTYLSLEVFAQATEGVSYIQLRNLISLAENYVDSLDGDGLSEEELKTFLAGQMPAPEADPLADIGRSIRELIEKLPNIGVNVGVGRLPQNPNTAETIKAPKQLTREEIEKIPPPQLALEVFGEKGVAELNEAAMRIPQ